MTNKATVLVTGGAGFIAKYTISALLENNYNVISVDKKDECVKSYKTYKFDVTNKKLEEVFKNNNIDYIIHLAALPSVSESIKNPILDSKDNYLATVNVCTLAKKYNIKKLVFSSTAALYANPQYLPVDEKHPVSFLSPYAITKNASEHFIKYSGLSYIIFRYSNVYGKGQDAIGEAGVVAKFFDKMSKNEIVEIHGTGEQFRDFINVKDVAKANVLALNTNIKNEIINVSTNTKLSINELAQILKKELNYNNEIIYTSQRRGDIEKSILDNSKLIKLLKFKPEIQIEQGIKDMLIK